MDPDDQHSSLTAHLIAPPSSGTITLELDGTFVYENTDPSASVDEFRYEVCDPSQACVGATVSVTIDHDAPTISCRLPTQVGMVGSAVSIDLATLFTPPPGESLVYDATNLPQSLSRVGALVSGTLQPGDVAGSPFASTLRASAGGAWASEDVMFQVLPVGDILLRDGFDFEDPNQRCE
jgi:VCBS repeat-containing protein